MKVLIVHNRYRQPGGEDTVFAAETELLRQNGQDVVTYVADNSDLRGAGSIGDAGRAFWSRDTYTALRKLIRTERPAVAHFHNVFFRVSPSAYYAARNEGAAVVQTLHNYRLVCPGALLLRRGRPCEKCVRRVLRWPGVVHGCYRGSRSASTVVAGSLMAHQLAGTWTRIIDRYVALTEFARHMFVEGGLPAEKIVVKPNFVEDDGGPGRGDGGFALFVGRLAQEKGVRTLLEAWSTPGDALPLKIVGCGPMEDEVARVAHSQSQVEWLGSMPRPAVRQLMRQARCVVVPSIWYESLPMVVLESFCAGTPVIASRTGSLATIVEEGRTGVMFEPGDPESLRSSVMSLVNSSGDLATMRMAARARYEESYCADSNYRQLVEIYRGALGVRTPPAAQVTWPEPGSQP